MSSRKTGKFGGLRASLTANKIINEKEVEAFNLTATRDIVGKDNELVDDSDEILYWINNSDEPAEIKKDNSIFNDQTLDINIAEESFLQRVGDHD